MPAFHFRVDGDHFENGAFRKRTKASQISGDSLNEFSEIKYDHLLLRI